MTTQNVILDTTQYVKINNETGSFLLQSHGDTVRIAFSDDKPVRSNTAFHELGGQAGIESVLQVPPIETFIWALAMTTSSKMTITKLNIYVPVNPQDEEGSPFDGDNPLPVADIDTNNRMSLNTVFGEKITGRRVPSVAVQFQYGLPEGFATETLLNGGTATLEDSLSKLATGINAAGSAAIQTNEYLRYVPGHEAYFFFTMALTQGVADSFQRVGLYDDNDGFYIGYEGADFCVSRMRDGVVEDQVTIDLLTVFEPQDGVFDPTKGNIYRITFGYLGFATINYEVMSPCGCWRTIHKIEYPNAENVTHIKQTNLPARAQVTNTGNTTNLEFRSGSLAFGIIDGAGTDPSSRLFSASLPDQTITSGNYNVVTFRNKDTFFGLENRVKARLMLISAATDLNKNASFQVIKNMDLTNTPTWTDVDTDYSTFEYSTDATVDILTGNVALPFIMFRTDSFFEKVEDLIVELNPGDTASIVVTTPGGAAGTVDVAFRWKELF